MATRGNCTVGSASRAIGHGTHNDITDVLEPPPWVFSTLFGGGKGRLAQARRARQEQGRAVGRPLLVARGAARRRLARGHRGPARPLHHPLRQVDRGRAGEAVRLRRADRRWAPRSSPPLQKHLRSAESIAWGLKILDEVATADEAWPILADLCERNDNTYTRDPSKKIQLLQLPRRPRRSRAAAKALVPYLDRHGRGRPLRHRRGAPAPQGRRGGARAAAARS